MSEYPVNKSEWTRLREMLRSINEEDITLSIEIMMSMRDGTNNTALYQLCMRARKYHLNKRYDNVQHSKISNHLSNISRHFR